MSLFIHRAALHRALHFALVLSGCAAANVAGAQTPLAALTPDTLELLEVDVPADPSHPVTLYFGRGQAEIAIDVFAADADAAHERLAFYLSTVSGEMPALGPDAYGDAGLVAFASGPWFAVVRRLRGSGDVRPMANAIAARLPRTRAAPMRASLPSLQRGVTRWSVPAGFVGSLVEATGALTVRRTARGWIFDRHEGAYTLHFVGIDAQLNRIEIRARE